MNAYYSHFFYSGTCRSTPAGIKTAFTPPYLTFFYISIIFHRFHKRGKQKQVSYFSSHLP